jgi:hypothetical protein
VTTLIVILVAALSPSLSSAEQDAIHSIVSSMTEPTAHRDEIRRAMRAHARITRSSPLRAEAPSGHEPSESRRDTDAL